jgi:glucose-6-phosphate 1-dehydrogenase
MRGRAVEVGRTLGKIDMNTKAIVEPQNSQIGAYFCEAPSDPCAIVMFGASGDLARRKLLPALYDLSYHACLGPRFRLLGFARTEMSDSDFTQKAGEFLPSGNQEGADDGKKTEFLKCLRYFSGNYDDPEAFRRLAQRLDELDGEGQLGGNRLYYLATPPEVYLHVIEQLKKAGLNKPKNEKSWARIIIEKPFGQVLEAFDESQVYRIDHYLGKETVQNMLVFRFGNGIFEPLWNRNYIDSVQITAAESLGVERRAAFYESAGALRDMIQSHVLQLTSLTAMEAPATFDATSVRNEKIKVLQSIRPFTKDSVFKSVIRGQYGPGQVDGKQVPGYRQEPGVKPDSATDTFVALKLHVDNWRWSGVPFYLRTGKRLARPLTEVAIQFKSAPHMVFRGENHETNSLVMNIQPDEGISLSFGAKSPGAQMRIQPVTMDFKYKDAFGGGTRPAYATLINDCIRGDATLFDRADSVEAAWTLVDPILEAWKNASPPPFPNYPAGSDGPRTVDDLANADGRHWRLL